MSIKRIQVIVTPEHGKPSRAVFDHDGNVIQGNQDLKESICDYFAAGHESSALIAELTAKLSAAELDAKTYRGQLHVAAEDLAAAINYKNAAESRAEKLESQCKQLAEELKQAQAIPSEVKPEETTAKEKKTTRKSGGRRTTSKKTTNKSE